MGQRLPAPRAPAARSAPGTPERLHSFESVPLPRTRAACSCGKQNAVAAASTPPPYDLNEYCARGMEPGSGRSDRCCRSHVARCTRALISKSCHGGEKKTYPHVSPLLSKPVATSRQTVASDSGLSPGTPLVHACLEGRASVSRFVATGGERHEAYKYEKRNFHFFFV